MFENSFNTLDPVLWHKEWNIGECSTGISEKLNNKFAFIPGNIIIEKNFLSILTSHEWRVNPGKIKC